MKYEVIFSSKAKKELLILVKSDKKNYSKVNAILDEIQLNPRTGIGKPELLKGFNKELWSRRINKKDRIVYEIRENIVTVYILSVKGHYDDK